VTHTVPHPPQPRRHRGARCVLALLSAAPAIAGAATPDANDAATATPIHHVLIIIGENRSFDHLFGLYRPPPGQSVANLLSKGIVNSDGTPGPHFADAAQFTATSGTTYTISPPKAAPFATLPPENTGYTPERPSNSRPPPFASRAAAAAADRGLPQGALALLTTGASGLPQNSIDNRIAHVRHLPDGPFPLTPSVPYDAYTASPTHRFYQMWQQLDCAADHAGPANPSGCLGDLFAWVEVTVGPGSNGRPRPAKFDAETTHEGATALGFYNAARGDAPFLTALATQFTLADNYHQAIMGGTGANHIALGTGDAIFYTDGQGHAATPPANQIENPNPQPGTNNFYIQDGYFGGSYSACADRGQPGVAPILAYLATLPGRPNPNCEPGHYYLLNNYTPGYRGDGSLDRTSRFTIPPSPVRTIGDALSAARISWRYYGEGWNDHLKHPSSTAYCNICNPFQYATSIMTNAAARAEHLRDTADLDAELAAGTLPAVAFVKPSDLNDGHPASSKVALFEAFTARILGELQAQKSLWAETAVFVIFDEGGGYYDSGYVQPLDFFGDGTRVPLIVVSPFAAGGRVEHSYTDHVSLLKFIEHNWRLPPLTARSRDNLPNPVTLPDNPYVPTNGPAIGDLMDMFRF
jgi:phospholipase C